MAKLIKNNNGEYFYTFIFKEGGFNDVWAKNKREAVKLAKKTYTGLTPDPSSFRKNTEESRRGYYEVGNMMTR